MPRTKTFGELVGHEELADPDFRAEWQRFAPAREFANALLRYRADHGLSQRALALEVGVSQPRIAKLESGEHNPSVDTIIKVAAALGIEFCVDVAPARRASRLVSKRARENGASVEYADVRVFAAASAR